MKKVSFIYPPLEGPGSPMLTQSRQFQWYSKPSYLFPIIPATAATRLSKEGYRIQWLDAIAEQIDLNNFLLKLKEFDADYVVLETKTPVIEKQLQIAERVKKVLPDVTIIATGEFASFSPNECIQHPQVDYVIEGGDYDFSLFSLLNHIENDAPLCSGVWLTPNQNAEKYDEDWDLNETPFIDRIITKAHLYGEKWKKRTPYFTMMSARDCHWNRCTFCSWTNLYKKYRRRPVDHCLDEIGYLIEKYGAKEIFDDSGSFPIGEWLIEFCQGMIKRGYNKKVIFSANMRFCDMQNLEILKLMKAAGFRKLKCGLESANQKTLDHIAKGITVEQIKRGSQLASQAKLDIHLTIMIGFPWESESDITNTFQLAKQLMTKGYVEMLQSTVVTPYPGTELYRECLRQNKFTINPADYSSYDMEGVITKTNDVNPEIILDFCQKIYKTYYHPLYILRRVAAIRSLKDFAYLFRGFFAIIGHIKDFGQTRRKV